jgi:hypothetical protein
MPSRARSSEDIGTDTGFAALREAFDRAAAAGHVVMTVTVSNAGPIAV